MSCRIAHVLPVLLLALLAAGAVASGAAHAEPAACAGGAACAVELERLAAEAVRSRVPSPDRFELVASRSDDGVSWGSEPVRVEILDVDGPGASGSARVRFRVEAGDGTVGEARVTVRGEIRGPALVARRALVRGASIPPDAVEVVEKNLTRSIESPLRDPSQVLGSAPTRTLGVGEILTASSIGGPRVVRRGQPVSLRIETDRMSVAATGVARRDGAVGEVIPAENSATGAVVVGRVEADGSLQVVPRGVSRGRR
jgi:flagella basal body P-ring formation protein FlgA